MAALVLPLVTIACAVIVASGMDEEIPVHFGLDGTVNRYGSPWEMMFGIVSVGLCTLLVAVMVPFPNVYNYPTQLTEQNVQAQYKNAVQMMVWLGFSCGLMTPIIALSSLGGSGTIWPIAIPLAVMFGSMIFFIARMSRL